MPREAEMRLDDFDDDNDGPGRGRTRDELYEEAKALNIEGRSQMNKRQLEEAVDRRRGRR
jgi:hypothetical protein